MKSYPVNARPAPGLPKPNRYQADFLYLVTLAQEVVPLEDRYFPPQKRAAIEKEILEKLGRPDCDNQTFAFCIQRYLSEFNCQHAYILDNPKPDRFTGRYPFRMHYVSNDVYVLDVTREHDAALIGKKIIAINHQPISAVEEKFFVFVSAESLCTKRAALESDPSPYSRPDYYRFAGMSDSISNRLQLDFADHTSAIMDPTWKQEIPWHRPAQPPHPITGHTGHQYDCRLFPEQHFAYLQFNACFDQAAILDGLHMVRPWLRPLVRAWLAWQFQLDQPSSVLQGIYDPERPRLKEYLTEALQDVQRQGITNLIIDLRRNAGGETALTRQLMYFLTRRDDLRDGREFSYNPALFAYYDPDGYNEYRAWYLTNYHGEPPSRTLLPMPQEGFFNKATDPESPYFVEPNRPVFEGRIILLVNQNTGSAASIMAGLLEDNGLAVSVGTATGNNPTGLTGMTPFRLPRSGMLLSLPTNYAERAAPGKGELFQPDYWVEDSMDDLEQSRDAAFEKALELMQIQSAKAGRISTNDMGAAFASLKDLKLAGRQPGWSPRDRGLARLESYSYFAPRSITFVLNKRHHSDRYYYTMVEASAGWELQNAWHTDRKGLLIERYRLH